MTSDTENLGEGWEIHVSPSDDEPLSGERGSRFKTALLAQVESNPDSLEFIVASKGSRNYWIWHLDHLVGHPEIAGKTWFAPINPAITGLVKENDVWVRLGHDEYIQTCTAYAHWRSRQSQPIPELMFPYYYSLEPYNVDG